MEDTGVRKTGRDEVRLRFVVGLREPAPREPEPAQPEPAGTRMPLGELLYWALLGDGRAQRQGA